MPAFPRFLQIHSLHNYTAALLNRDDSGLAKRLPYGDAMRTRISSQCLKRHWRMNDDQNALRALPKEELPHSVRSRELVSKKILGALGQDCTLDKEILGALAEELQKAVYGDKGAKKESRQPLLLGVPEIDYLANQFKDLVATVQEEGDDKKAATERAKEFYKNHKSNMAAMRANTAIPGGLAAALFGRMITSDPAANIEAPIYVAHSFTTHKVQKDDDYFAVVDDLDTNGAGADHIGEMDLTSGIFYGYTVVNVPGLIANLTGKSEEEQKNLTEEERALAGEIIRRLVHSIAEVSPGAKLGATAPFGYASTVMIEAGDRQPRSLSGAFREAVSPEFAASEEAMAQELKNLVENYQTDEERRFMSLRKQANFIDAQKLSLPDLAQWAKKQVVSDKETV